MPLEEVKEWLIADGSYRVELACSEEKYLRYPGRFRLLEIFATLEFLTDSPRPKGVKKLEGADQPYRIRIDGYHVVYEIVDRMLLVVVIRIAHRKDACR